MAVVVNQISIACPSNFRLVFMYNSGGSAQLFLSVLLPALPCKKGCILRGDVTTRTSLAEPSL